MLQSRTPFSFREHDSGLCVFVWRKLACVPRAFGAERKSARRKCYFSFIYAKILFPLPRHHFLLAYPRESRPQHSRLSHSGSLNIAPEYLKSNFESPGMRNKSLQKQGFRISRKFDFPFGAHQEPENKDRGECFAPL